MTVAGIRISGSIHCEASSMMRQFITLLLMRIVSCLVDRNMSSAEFWQLDNVVRMMSALDMISWRTLARL
ncbi:hypothetical protein DERF_005872 [Dermatophagoides farinae]|uniref:Uncharacterized protein n=1 Tax=Dermatophagoides farinae TaxID=6954 RepID=A0A922I7V0_DERFA|nr:hypothetical protein DERF_005872 [Dermatophagoides farinae]